MNLGDLLELIAILVAVIALISDRSREYIWLKFNTAHLLILGTIIVLIHYFMFFSWFISRSIFIASFVIPGAPTANTWAYLLSITLIGFMLYRIFFAKFPIANLGLVRSYYQRLLLSEDVEFLSNLIRRMHLSRIPEYIRAIGNYQPTIQDDIGLFQRRKKIAKGRIDMIKEKRLLYEEMVFNTVVIHEHFVNRIAAINPYYFTDLIAEIKDKRVYHDDLVNRFLQTVLKTRNVHFIRELKRGYYSSGNEKFVLYDDCKILKALLTDANVASVTQAWRGVCNPGLDEIANPSKGLLSKLQQRPLSSDGDELWDLNIFCAIEYLDILVYAAIVQKVNDHMWLPYYHFYVQYLIGSLASNMDGSESANSETVIFQLIDNILWKMHRWLEESVENDFHLMDSILECIGTIIWHVGGTDRLNNESKNKLIKVVWEKSVLMTMLVHEGEDPDTSSIDHYRKEARSLYLKPINYYGGGRYRHQIELYKKALRYAWENRDDYDFPIKNEGVRLYKVEVIDKLESLESG